MPWTLLPSAALAATQAPLLGPLWLVPGTYTVGRGECTIRLDKASVSRLHAKILCDLPAEPWASTDVRPPGIVLQDVSSYGTRVNGTRHSRSTVPLSDGDVLDFVDFPQRFTVRYRPLALTCHFSPDETLLADCQAKDLRLVSPGHSESTGQLPGLLSVAALRAFAAGERVVAESFVESLQPAAPVTDVSFRDPCVPPAPPNSIACLQSPWSEVASKLGWRAGFPRASDDLVLWFGSEEECRDQFSKTRGTESTWYLLRCEDAVLAAITRLEFPAPLRSRRAPPDIPYPVHKKPRMPVREPVRETVRETGPDLAPQKPLRRKPFRKNLGQLPSHLR